MTMPHSVSLATPKMHKDMMCAPRNVLQRPRARMGDFFLPFSLLDLTTRPDALPQLTEPGYAKGNHCL